MEDIPNKLCENAGNKAVCTAKFQFYQAIVYVFVCVYEREKSGRRYFKIMVIFYQWQVMMSMCLQCFLNSFIYVSTKITSIIIYYTYACAYIHIYIFSTLYMLYKYMCRYMCVCVFICVQCSAYSLNGNTDLALEEQNFEPDLVIQ